jgi:hypothetical protein
MVAVIVPISPGNRTEGVTVKSAIITLGFSASTGTGTRIRTRDKQARKQAIVLIRSQSFGRPF